jgi:TolB-like protein/Flp pilus assembly protein TadD
VLPLENLTGDPSEDYFAEGLTDALITRLAQIHALRVISRTSVLRYKGRSMPVPQIAKELRVDAIVQGAVVRSGTRVRISGQLIQASTDRHLWADFYEGDLKDILRLQADVAGAIVSQIRINLTPNERTRLTSAGRIDPEAYGAYLKGRYFLNKPGKASRRKAVEYFRQAIEKDPTYAEAYSWLSNFYSMQESFASTHPKESMAEARAAAIKALELDDNLAEAHTALAAVLYRYDWDWTEAEAEFKRALELNPSSSEAHRQYAVFLKCLRRFDEAIAEGTKAQTLDPLSFNVIGSLGYVFYFARRYDRAIEQARRALDLDPNNSGAHEVLGLGHGQNGNLPGAVEELEKAVALSERKPVQLGLLGYMYARAGDRGRAQRILDELKQTSAHSHLLNYGMAVIHAGLDEPEQALGWLERGWRDHSFQLANLSVDPCFDSLRSHPRFRELVRRIGL